ncbi:bifunctional diaminohydroxyphosphoribosylaminopyrimidine deaminase/5-amino-6-(5-phosphoribosylamino)uracil reductase RibD [Planctomycetota bacterium]
MKNQNEKFMLSALKLAKKGIGSVEPNPAVGAILVKDGQIIGKGYHKKFGGPHAEINAIEDCKKQGCNPSGATMYVTLEPCCHQGKTAPCTDAIIEAGLSKVVIAMIDPSEHAKGLRLGTPYGGGIEQLRSAGIEVQAGLCESEAKLLNAPFVKYAATGKCWVIVKWAQSIDGKLSYADGGRERWISNEQSRKDAHKLRRRVQGILVGIETVLADDPLLTPRPSRGKRPVRIILDSRLRIPANCRLLSTTEEGPVLIVTSDEAIGLKPELVGSIIQAGAELLTVPAQQARCDLGSVINELSKRGIAQLLVEGGPRVIASFLEENLADEVRVYIAPKILGKSGSADISEPMAGLMKGLGLHYVDIKRFGDNVRISGLLGEKIS